jgi:N-acylneuraminate cytidylyltransferase
MGSKGIPFKNRELFWRTAQTIPSDKKRNVWVTTDDPIISELARDYDFNVINRPSELASDTATIRETVLHVIQTANIRSDELIAMLYLTYPQRTWQDVEDAIDFFLDYYKMEVTDSLLCKKEVKTHPYLCMYERGVNGIFGSQVVRHDEYRRQDYPKCYEISHYISIFKASAVYKLNRNLYCDSTVFYPIDDVIDIDLPEHLEKYIQQDEN